jgi:iron(III) transport system permease protein
MNSLNLLVGGTLAALGVLVALPVGMVVLQAIFPHLAEGSWRDPFQPFVAAANDPHVLPLLGSTLRLGLGVVAGCFLLGGPLGAVRGLFRVPGARCWDLLFLIPFLLPPYIAALAWTLALQPGGYARQLLGFDLGGLLFSQPGLVSVMSLSIFPVVYFAVSRSMASAGGRLAEVARVFGANPLRAFFRVTLPLALPAIAASLLLAFTLAIEEYGVPAALGTEAGISVLTTSIERRLADWPIDLPGASVLSLLLVAVGFCAFFLHRLLLRGKNVETTTGKPAPTAPAELGAWRWPVLLAFAAIALLATVAPIASMLLTAFSRTLSGGLSAGNLGLQNFASILGVGGEALSAAATSFSLAAGAAVLTGALGFTTAWCVSGKHTRFRLLMDMLSIMPSALPGVVLGVGLILLWNRQFWPVSPYDSAAILLLSYSCLLLPYPVRYATAALAQIGPNLEAAARVHGAGAATAMRLIAWPLVRPSVLAAMLMVFAIASRELVTSLLLAPAGVQTISIFIWRQFEQGSVGAGMAMATLAVLCSVGLMLLAMRRRQA